MGSRITVTEAPAGIFAHRRSRSTVVVRNFHDDQVNSPRSSARLARCSARQATSMPNLTSFMAWSFLCVADQSALRLRPVHVPQGCDHPDIQEAGVRIDNRPPSSRTGMHVRREARLVDDHRYGVELALAPTPAQSSQKNRPDAPYEGLPPNRWMPGTNAKCPSSPSDRGPAERQHEERSETSDLGRRRAPDGRRGDVATGRRRPQVTVEDFGRCQVARVSTVVAAYRHTRARRCTRHSC